MFVIWPNWLVILVRAWLRSVKILAAHLGQVNIGWQLIVAKPKIPRKSFQAILTIQLPIAVSDTHSNFWQLLEVLLTAFLKRGCRMKFCSKSHSVTAIILMIEKPMQILFFKSQKLVRKSCDKKNNKNFWLAKNQMKSLFCDWRAPDGFNWNVSTPLQPFPSQGGRL